MEEVESVLASYRARMNDVSEFMKTLKLRMTIGFNDMHDRVGTLWEGRFGSVLLEDSPNSELLRLVAAYIDLNPVRAKIVQDPARYVWSGFGDATRSKTKRSEWARQGISSLYADGAGKEPEEYRKLLMTRACRTGAVPREEEVLEIQPLENIYVRNDTLMRGKAIGRRAFVMGVTGGHPVGGVMICHDGKDGQLLVAGQLTRRKR